KIAPQPCAPSASASTLIVVNPWRNRVRSLPVTRSRPQLERSMGVMATPLTLLLLRRRGRLLGGLGHLDLALDPALELGLALPALHLRRTSIVSASHAGLLWRARISHRRPPAAEDHTKMSSGRNAETTMLGTSTTSLIARSTATLQIAYACWRVKPR